MPQTESMCSYDMGRPQQPHYGGGEDCKWDNSDVSQNQVRSFMHYGRGEDGRKKKGRREICRMTLGRAIEYSVSGRGYEPPNKIFGNLDAAV